MPGSPIKYSLVIPVYRNQESIPSLLAALKTFTGKYGAKMEVVLVVDGSPDDSYSMLAVALPRQPFASQLLLLSKNCGSFNAIKAGMEAARGDHLAVIAADLQEPLTLVREMYDRLAADKADVVFGQRTGRHDSRISALLSNWFWHWYRKLVFKDIPPGGVDIFGCNRAVRDAVLRLPENNTSLVGQLFWLGFRREFIPYERQKRQHGKSAWSLTKRINYLLDSVFAFSDLPIRILLGFGVASIIAAMLLTLVVLWAKLSGAIAVPGYAATVVVIAFFSGINALGMGVVGLYVWRTFTNTQHRPNFVVMRQNQFVPAKMKSIPPVRKTTRRTARRVNI